MAIYAKIVDSTHSCKGDDIELDLTTGAGVSLTRTMRLKKTFSANVFRSFFVCGLSFSAVTSFFAISIWSVTSLSTSGFAPSCFRRDRTLDEGSIRARVRKLFEWRSDSAEIASSEVSQSDSLRPTKSPTSLISCRKKRARFKGVMRLMRAYSMPSREESSTKRLSSEYVTVGLAPCLTSSSAISLCRYITAAARGERILPRG